MKTPRICAALVALAVAAPLSLAQEKTESMAARLLERLDSIANRLDDEELGAEIRAELQDLMKMLREQLGTAGDQPNDATDSYRKALVEGARASNLDTLRGGALRALQDFDASKLEGQFEALKSLGSLQRLGDVKVNLGEGNAELFRNLLERAQDPETSAAVEKALEAVRDALDAVDDETVNDILDTVRKAIQDASKGIGAAQNPLRAGNLYRALGENLPRGLNFSQLRDRAQENREDAQEYRENWQEAIEEARKQWEEQSAQAREQWQKYIEKGRVDMEEQLQKALESYRRALQRRRGTGEDESPFAVFDTEGGGVFFPSGTQTYSFPKGTPFNFTQYPESSAWRVTTPGSGFVFEGEGDSAWKVAPEGSFLFGEGNYVFGEGGEGWRVYTAPEGEEGKAGGFYFRMKEGEDEPRGFYRIEPGSGQGGGVFWAPEGEAGRAWGVIKNREDEEDEKETPSFLELFKQDRNRDSLRETEELEISEIELMEVPDFELAEIELTEVPDFELAEIELIEPVLELTVEPELIPVRETDVQLRIEAMVEELRVEMREIRELVRTLRQKAKEKSPR